MEEETHQRTAMQMELLRTATIKMEATRTGAMVERVAEDYVDTPGTATTRTTPTTMRTRQHQRTAEMAMETAIGEEETEVMATTTVETGVYGESRKMGMPMEVMPTVMEMDAMEVRMAMVDMATVVMGMH